MERFTKNIYSAFLISITISFAFVYYIYTDFDKTGIAMWIFESNVKVYVIFLIIFFALFFIINMFESLMDKNRAFKNEKEMRLLKKNTQIFLVILFTATGFSLYTHWGLTEQFEEIGVCNGTWYDFPMTFRIILMLLFFCWMAWMLAKDKDIEDASVWVIYAISIVVTFMCLFIVNPFSHTNSTLDFSMALCDNTSVTETIYNVFDGVPYTYSTAGLYGHYALFFLLPLKIFGGGSIQVVGLIAFCGCLEQLATIYIINTFAPKKWIKALLALAAVIRTSYTYPAISPIRTLFPMVMCAFITFLYMHKKQVWFTKWLCVGYVICSAAVLWNTEMGLACIVGFTAYILVELWQKDPPISYRNCLPYLSCFIFSMGSILLAIIVVNIYNFFCGVCQPVFRSFFYPYISSSWATGLLRDNVPLGNHAWIYIMILLLGCASWGLYNTRLFHREKFDFLKEAKLIAGISITGIIVFTYYFNEAHWGCMEIVHKIATCLVALILYKFWTAMSNRKENAIIECQWQRGIVILSLMIFASLAIQLVSDPIRISARYKAEAYNVSLLRENIDKLTNEIPTETYGVGLGINIIYHECGWGNHAKYRDTSAIDIGYNGGATEMLIEEILSQDSFLIGNFYKPDQLICETVLSITDSYKLEKTIDIMGCEYAYYVKEK